MWVDFTGYPSNHFSGCRLNGKNKNVSSRTALKDTVHFEKECIIKLSPSYAVYSTILCSYCCSQANPVACTHQLLRTKDYPSEFELWL